MFRYLRLKLFHCVQGPMSGYARLTRMKWFLNFLQKNPTGTVKVLDLGGHPDVWRWVERPLDITLLNLPGHVQRAHHSHHRFTYVEGDACDVHRFSDQSFDIVFSNSVIEHVGPADRQQAFAVEARRLGRRFWIQTPSRYFPIEAHCGMPGWWFYPSWLRLCFIRGWKRKLPEWTEMVEGTRVLDKNALMALFPEARIRTERFFGFPKSYIVYSAD